MHTCLQVADIVEHFVEHLCVEGRYRKGWLIHMALTCRTFYEPAMDILWRELDDFLLLLKCFPDDVMEERCYELDFVPWDPLPSKCQLEWVRLRSIVPETQ